MAEDRPWEATDGGLKFDLTKFDPNYFDRLRARTQALRDAGIYAGIYLFTGEFLNLFRCGSDGYPFTGANNINGIDDGYTEGPKGTSSITMTAPNAITRFQDAYVEKVIDTLNDLPNVLWIVSEEAPDNSTWWNNHQIAHTRTYEARKAVSTPHRVRRAHTQYKNNRSDHLQLRCRLGGAGCQDFADQILRRRAPGMQSGRQ